MSGRCAFHRASHIEVPADELGHWHFRPGAIHRLIPPWERIEVRREATPLVDGAIAEIAVRKGPVVTTLVARHEEVDPPRQFVDVQASGPFGSWRHLHRFDPHEDGGSTLEDSIRYDPPGGWIGRTFLQPLLERELARQFAFRHERTRGDLALHAGLASRFGARTLRVGVTGASGLVGRQLCAFLSTGGHEVVRFVRGRAGGRGERPWNPSDPASGLDPAHLEDLDAVVHLAGAGIADARWTPERKREILESRTKGTEAVARALARTSSRRAVLVSASAIGFYGARGDEPVDERSAGGTGFLAEVVAAWERAADPARDAGVRVVHPRIGVVLSAAGGALARMRLPFLLGAGGPIGSGRQGLSWISLDDLLGALAFLVRNDAMSGPVNCTAPYPLPQRGFAQVLGRVLRRPSFAPMPGAMVRLAFGEMGERLLLEGAFVRPDALVRAGFRFRHGSLEQALRLELGRLHSNGID